MVTFPSLGASREHRYRIGGLLVKPPIFPPPSELPKESRNPHSHNKLSPVQALPPPYPSWHSPPFDDVRFRLVGNWFENPDARNTRALDPLVPSVTSGAAIAAGESCEMRSSLRTRYASDAKHAARYPLPSISTTYKPAGTVQTSRTRGTTSNPYVTRVTHRRPHRSVGTGGVVRLERSTECYANGGFIKTWEAKTFFI